MKLGDLRRELEKYKDWPNDTIILAAVEDDSGEFVDQDVYSKLTAWWHDDDRYLYIETRVQ